MGSARKHRQWKRSNSVTELSGARSEIVKDRGSTENTGGGDSSNEHPSEDREMLTPIQILCNSLKIAELVGAWTNQHTFAAKSMNSWKPL